MFMLCSSQGDIDGIEATRRIVANNPDIGVVVLTMFDDDDTVLDAMSAGARGYLLKGAEQDEILCAIDAVVNGETILGQGIATRILGRLGHARDHAEPSPFTDRGQAIVRARDAGLG